MIIETCVTQQLSDLQAGTFKSILLFRQYITTVVIFVCIMTFFLAPTHAQERGVRIVKNEASRRVDVFIDGQPFTSYVWPEVLTKPVLYPLRSAQGTIVTRGFPLDPRPGERVDHPHHAGLWFNYGDVNGVDFWNNSTALSPEERRKMGSIVQRGISSTLSNTCNRSLRSAMPRCCNSFS